VKYLSPGVYVDDHNQMHVDLVELLEANGYENTPANQERMIEMARAMFADRGIDIDVED
jgi:hypothetical protein